MSGTIALAQDAELQARLAALRAQGEAEGWTFTVGETPVSHLTIDELCGLSVPEDWYARAPHDHSPPRLGLPPAFDWREQAGCPPVRNQGSCGSCWAFATVAPLECNILIHDGVTVDLSEQWLVSCNRSGYGCAGGWFAHEYHQDAADACGGTGAVLEADFPYAAADLNCDCPYEHAYTIDGWAYVGGVGGVPSVEAIKQAILDYGPVSAGVCVTQPFLDYTGGVFNACSSGTVNHAVTIVGWDDNQGEDGVWIIRNSWGPGWGEGGYMRIEYGCSSIGYAACYVVYSGGSSPAIELNPQVVDFGSVPVGDTATASLTLTNAGSETLTGSVTAPGSPFSLVGPASYSLQPGENVTITFRFAPQLQGEFTGSAYFSGAGSATATLIGNGTGNGPGNTCSEAPAIGDGTFTGSNVGADTSISASCGGGGEADIWWRYQAYQTGTLTVDTCGSDFDTVLSVYSVCGGSELVCDDNGGGCPGSFLNSRVQLPVSAGQSYYIRVAGVGSARGQVVLNTAVAPITPTISGRILTEGGTPVAGVTLTGLPDAPVTDENGEYAVSVPYGFNGTVIPQKTAYTFTPESTHYTYVTEDQAHQDYLATPPSFTISGRVTDADGDPLPAVSMTGLPGNPITDDDGRYRATVPLGFTGTVTPSRNACSFDPPSRRYENVTGDVVTQDYEGRIWTGALRVVLEPQTARDAGAQWNVDGGAWLESGQIVSGLPTGQHVIAFADLPGWTAPTAETVIIEKDQTLEYTARYTRRSYRLTLLGGSEAVGTVTALPPPEPDGRYVQDTVVTLIASPLPGFRVRSWTGADEAPASGQVRNTVTMDRDRTVIVQFDLDPFAVYQLSARVSGGGGVVEPQRGTYRAGEVVELRAVPDEGFQVKRWTGTDDDTSAAEVNTVTMSGHRTVEVEFEPWSDCNADGVSDRYNVMNEGAEDCNANGLPDECEPDTDGNGVIDDCEPPVTLGAETEEEPSPGPVVRPCGFGLVSALLLSSCGLCLLGLRGRRQSPC